MACFSTYSAMPKVPNSRPMPLCLVPPGTVGKKTALAQKRWWVGPMWPIVLGKADAGVTRA
jgi:hypothetical protein